MKKTKKNVHYPSFTFPIIENSLADFKDLWGKNVFTRDFLDSMLEQKVSTVITKYSTRNSNLKIKIIAFLNITNLHLIMTLLL